MTNRKGESIVSSNTFSIIIAVIGLALIFGVVFVIYDATTATPSGQNAENAKTILEEVNGRINNLEDGQRGEFQIRGVNDWSLIAWGANEQTKPAGCLLDSCVCACPFPKLSETNIEEAFFDETLIDKNQRLEACQSANICKNYDASTVRAVTFTKASDPLHEGDLSFDFIELESKLQNICLIKDKESIQLQYYTDAYLDAGGQVSC